MVNAGNGQVTALLSLILKRWQYESKGGVTLNEGKSYLYEKDCKKGEKLILQVKSEHCTCSLFKFNLLTLECCYSMVAV